MWRTPHCCQKSSILPTCMRGLCCCFPSRVLLFLNEFGLAKDKPKMLVVFRTKIANNCSVVCFTWWCSSYRNEINSLLSGMRLIGVVVLCGYRCLLCLESKVFSSGKKKCRTEVHCQFWLVNLRFATNLPSLSVVWCWNCCRSANSSSRFFFVTRSHCFHVFIFRLLLPSGHV
jgi:hypothetical protein